MDPQETDMEDAIDGDNGRNSQCDESINEMLVDACKGDDAGDVKNIPNQNENEAASNNGDNNAEPEDKGDQTQGSKQVEENGCEPQKGDQVHDDRSTPAAPSDDQHITPESVDKMIEEFKAGGKVDDKLAYHIIQEVIIRIAYN
jgi:hypothetical protein